VPRADLSGEIGSSIYFGGLVDEVSGGINPACYVAGLARRLGTPARCFTGRHASWNSNASVVVGAS
jgi:hypothetical protein